MSKRVRRGEEYESNGDLCRTRELTLPLLPLSPPFDRSRPSNVIASLTAATDDADATEQLSADSGGECAGDGGTERAGTKDREESSDGREWDDDTSTVLSTAVTRPKPELVTSHDVTFSGFGPGAAGPARSLQADTPLPWHGVPNLYKENDASH